jgi:DNA-binding FadR family transcriptional regulator
MKVVALERDFSGADLVAQVPHLRIEVERRSAVDIVCEKIAVLIATGVLQIGDQLPGERELASSFGVSRETVRGAVRNLVGCGVVDVAHGSRTRIINDDIGSLKLGATRIGQINRYDVEDVNRARFLMEQTVVGDAAENINAETLAFLDASLKQQEVAIDDPIRFLICDRDFHNAIYRACGNPVLAEFVMDLYSYMMGYRRRAMSRPGAVGRSYADHRAIVAALRARDRAETQRAFGLHLQRIHDSTKSELTEGWPNTTQADS